MMTDVNFWMYVHLFLFGLLGWLIQSLLKIRSMQIKARLANVQFGFWEYFTTDWVTHVVSIVTILTASLLVKNILMVFPKVSDWLQALFVTVGYSNGDIVSRLLSRVNDKVNAAIDYKTSIADKATGNEKTPTPK